MINHLLLSLVVTKPYTSRVCLAECKSSRVSDASELVFSSNICLHSALVIITIDWPRKYMVHTQLLSIKRPVVNRPPAIGIVEFKLRAILFNQYHQR